MLKGKQSVNWHAVPGGDQWAIKFENHTPSVEDFGIPTKINVLVVPDPHKFLVNVCSRSKQNTWEKGKIKHQKWHSAGIGQRKDTKQNPNGMVLFSQYFSWNFTPNWQIFPAGFSIQFNWNFYFGCLSFTGGVWILNGMAHCCVLHWVKFSPNWKYQLGHFFFFFVPDVSQTSSFCLMYWVLDALTISYFSKIVQFIFAQ